MLTKHTRVQYPRRCRTDTVKILDHYCDWLFCWRFWTL